MMIKDFKSVGKSWICQNNVKHPAYVCMWCKKLRTRKVGKFPAALKKMPG